MAESIQVTEGPNKAISGSFPTGEGTGVAAVVNVDTKKPLISLYSDINKYFPVKAA